MVELFFFGDYVRLLLFLQVDYTVSLEVLKEVVWLDLEFKIDGMILGSFYSVGNENIVLKIQKLYFVSILDIGD